MKLRQFLSLLAAAALSLAMFASVACEGDDRDENGTGANNPSAEDSVTSADEFVVPGEDYDASAGGDRTDDADQTGNGDDGGGSVHGLTPAGSGPSPSTRTPEVASDSGISAETEPVGPKRDVKVDVRVAGGDLPPFKAFQVIMAYDASQMRFVDVEPSPAFAGHVCVPPVTEPPGKLAYGCTLLGQDIIEGGDGLLMSATFSLAGEGCVPVHFVTYDEAGAQGSYLVNMENQALVVELNDFDIC